MCGEKYFFLSFRPVFQGSPPRVRGKEERDAAANSKTGITPACAGKRDRRPRPCARHQDHPRVCGEKRWRRTWQRCAGGSPPRVRGKAHHLLNDISHVGITPACAGKRLYDIRRTILTEDHPRVCGEKIQQNLDVDFSQGSPPRVRGKVNVYYMSVDGNGITPACAGKSWENVIYWDTDRDHPRVCGEKGFLFSP